ncbi:MAG: hypothetical protein J5486_07505 [Bacteroidaceae bacterium]|nr:hypothetical protein [Bacteroidaceae bacterium]
MKHILSSILLLAAAILPGLAANTSQTVTQVSTAISLTADLDYHISSADPFTTTGSIDIVNTDHAVIIFDKIRPSKVISSYLTFIKINGEEAVEGTNCQVRLYNLGAIVYPYGKESSLATGFHPLKVYSEPDLQGESCELFGLENSGGYMNTLPLTKLKGKIKSFTLKRGYMVTFSLKDGGRGYSRCFIADQADLTVNLPALMAGRICSYRVFRWYNAGKKQLANYMNREALTALNVQSSYDWAQGNSSFLPDFEWVPNHIYEDYPSSATIGGVSHSPHTKTNNEPRNSSDDHPQDLETILNNWENMMRTGLRLCSPASWDGSDYWNATGFLADFLDAVDARGWRCDIIDLHCYWAEGSFGNMHNWSDKYKRPIWISEWCWGASWNNNGAFASGVTEANVRDALSRICSSLNNWNYVERYYYWNSERDPSRLYKDGALTPAGEYYASMNSGLGYCNYGNYIPAAPPLYNPSDLTASHKKTTVTLAWTNKNGNLTEETIIQEKINGRWVGLDTLYRADAESMTFTQEYDENSIIGLHTYRIVNLDYDGKRRISGEASFFQGGAYNLGELFVGQIEASNTSVSTSNFAMQDAAPMVFVGMPTYKNSANGVVNHVTSVAKSSFKFFFDPWTEGASMDFTKAETADYVIVPRGNFTIAGLQAEVDTCGLEDKHGSARMNKGEEWEVKFRQPFPEGVIPVVFLQNVSTSTTAAPATPKVYNITNTGFTMKLVKQAGESYTKKITAQYVYYLAIAPGHGVIEGTGKEIFVDRAEDLVGGTLNCSLLFRDEQGDTLLRESPYVVAAAQTNNLDFPSVMRRVADNTVKVTDDDGNAITYTYGIRVRRQMDPSLTSATIGTNKASENGDVIGYMVIADAPIEDAVRDLAEPTQQLDIEVRNRAIYTSASARIYNINGAGVQAGTPLPRGVYVVTSGQKSRKVYVK